MVSVWVLGNATVPPAVPFTVPFSPVPHYVPQKPGQKGCGKRKFVPFVPFPFFTIPKQTVPPKKLHPLFRFPPVGSQQVVLVCFNESAWSLRSYIHYNVPSTSVASHKRVALDVYATIGHITRWVKLIALSRNDSTLQLCHILIVSPMLMCPHTSCAASQHQ